MAQVVKKQYVSKDGAWVEVASGGGSSAPAEVQTPIGAIIAYGGAAAPTGWHLCDGSAHGSAELQAVTGSANAPDLRGKFIIAADATYPAESEGGEATHTLTVAEMPAHEHPVHMNLGVSYDDIILIDNTVVPGGPSNRFSLANGAGLGLLAKSVGSGAAHNNLPPYYALTYIIKTA